MFGQPHQHAHRVSGIKAAIASPNTPSHLKPHLKRQLEEHMKKQTSTKPLMGGMAPASKMQVTRMGAPGDPAQQTKPPKKMKKKFAKGAKSGANKGNLKVQGKKVAQRNPILGIFPGVGGSGPDDDGY